jgi:hypothetical protein
LAEKGEMLISVQNSGETARWSSEYDYGRMLPREDFVEFSLLYFKG